MFLAYFVELMNFSKVKPVKAFAMPFNSKVFTDTNIIPYFIAV
jgi:hypothetical protein